MRYKLFDRRWHCVTTRQRQLEWAERAACEIYGRARFREDEGLPQRTKRFDVIARECIKALEREIEQSIRRETNRDYIRATNNYMIPYFGKFMLANITIDRVRHYEQWRNEKMGRVPRHLDVIAEEAAHRQRMAAEQARAVNYQPVGIVEFEVSVG